MVEKTFKLTIRVVWWMLIFQALFGLASTIISIFTLVLAFKGSIVLLFGFFIAALFAYFGWANALSTIQITNESVTVTVLHGRYRINWNEVRKIIRQGYIIALIGNDKRVVLALQLMNTKNRDKLIEYFAHQIEERKIEYTTTEQAPLIQHNSRVTFF